MFGLFGFNDVSTNDTEHDDGIHSERFRSPQRTSRRVIKKTKHKPTKS